MADLSPHILLPWTIPIYVCIEKFFWPHCRALVGRGLGGCSPPKLLRFNSFQCKYISLKIIQILLYSNWDLICSVICNFPKMVLTLNLKQDFKWTFFQFDCFQCKASNAFANALWRKNTYIVQFLVIQNFMKRGRQ